MKPQNLSTLAPCQNIWKTQTKEMSQAYYFYSSKSDIKNSKNYGIKIQKTLKKKWWTS